ncbi:hypothetical protein QE152_g31947 [Popillia japonica]|uniref:Rna-directed dna polymerase from mobile element jockey-like n=1 Tax=Popillia japonica TaxID=7064 RepID=A0AAW1J0W1_POPJA
MDTLAEHISIFYQNVRGLCTKTQTLTCNLLNSDFDIVCLTETWLNPNILASEISNNKYSIFRRDRCITTSKKADGGGVLMALDNTLPASVRLDWQSQAEDLWITVSVIDCGWTGRAKPKTYG